MGKVDTSTSTPSGNCYYLWSCTTLAADRDAGARRTARVGRPLRPRRCGRGQRGQRGFGGVPC